MRRSLFFGAAIVLSGCGVWSPTIRSDVMDYNDVLDATPNQLLLINVLEASDDAPLHFAALPNIHGSLTASASLQGAVPVAPHGFGPSPTSVITDTVTPTVSVQSAPSFEVDNVEAKDFVTGISSPIDPKYIKYWVDRGLDKRIILLMFFSSVEIVDTKYSPCNPVNAATAAARSGTSSRLVKQCQNNGTFDRGAVIVIHNNPRKAADQIEACERSGKSDCYRRTEFELYLTLVDSLKEGATANAYSQRTLVAHDQVVATKDAGGIDPAKYQLERLGDGNYDLFSIPTAPSFAFCLDGKFETLTGWQVQAADEMNSAPEKIRKVMGKDKKLHKVVELAMPPRGNVCSDPVLNVLPFIRTQKLPSAQAFLSPDGSSPQEPYFPSPCAEPSPMPEHGTPWFAVGRPYCELFLNYLATRLGQGYPDDRYRIILTLRSVGEMIRFLGDVTYYQKHLPQSAHLNIPLTLGYDHDCHYDKSGNLFPNPNCLDRDGGALFRFYQGTDTGRISVRYRGETYSVAEHTPSDHTLEVLSIVNQLVNLNKSALDLRTTPTVQVVP